MRLSRHTANQSMGTTTYDGATKGLRFSYFFFFARNFLLAVLRTVVSFGLQVAKAKCLSSCAFIWSACA